MKQIKLIHRLYLWIHLNQGKLTICYSSSWAYSISCGNAEQVTLSTTKLRQNKEKNKNSEFWNDNNEYSLHPEGKPSSIYCFWIESCNVMHDGRNVWWNRHKISENSIANMPTPSTTKLRENKENKNSTFLTGTMFSLCFVKQNCHSTVL